MTPEEIETYRKESKRNVAMGMRESEEQKFREYIEKPTLMEALVEIQKRVVDFEAQVKYLQVQINAHTNGQYHNGHTEKYYYGGDDNAE